MKALKFTGHNRKSRYGANDYAPVGEWSDRRGLDLCVSGWHVPTSDYLYKWIDLELWEVEVRGAQLSDGEKSVHEQIKFVRKVDAWNLGDYAHTCADSAANYAARSAARSAANYAARSAANYAADYAASAARSAANYAASAADHAAYSDERTRQNQWITNLANNQKG